MASLLSGPWIEDRVVSALLYHKQKKPQDRSSQVAQVISVRRNSNIVVLSDGNFSVESCYDNVNGTLQSGTLVSLKHWSITTSGTSGVSRDKDDICLHVANLDVIGGQGMGIVGKPLPIEESVEVRRVLDSWKLASTSELLHHTKPPSGDVAKLLQDAHSHHRVLRQYVVHSGNVHAGSLSRDRVLTKHKSWQQLESPVSRKRPLPENRTAGNEKASNHSSPHLELSKNQLQEDKEPEATGNYDDSVDDYKEMSIGNMLIIQDDDGDDDKDAEKEIDVIRSPAMKQRKGPPQFNEENNRNTVNPYLKLWLKLTQQQLDTVVERNERTEGSLLKKWRSMK